MLKKHKCSWDPLVAVSLILPVCGQAEKKKKSFLKAKINYFIQSIIFKLPEQKLKPKWKKNSRDSISGME